MPLNAVLWRSWNFTKVQIITGAYRDHNSQVICHERRATMKLIISSQSMRFDFRVPMMYISHAQSMYPPITISRYFPTYTQTAFNAEFYLLSLLPYRKNNPISIL